MPRTERLEIRLTTEELLVLRNAAALTGRDVSAFARTQALEVGRAVLVAHAESAGGAGPLVDA